MNNGKVAMTRLGWLASGLACILTILVLTPFAVEMPIAGVDGSWAYAMNVATAEHLRFGKDIIFTFGPLASIYTEVYHPATDHLMIGGAMLLSVAVFAGLFAVTSPHRRVLLPLFPFLVALTWLPDWDGWRDAVFMLLPLLLPITVARGQETGKPNWAAIILLAIAIAILPLIKGSLSVPAALASLVAVLLCWRESPRLAITLFVVEVGVLIAAWLTAGQSLLDLPVYFLAQMPLISGYTDGMSVSVDGRPLNIVIYLLASVMLVALSTFGGVRRRWYLPVLVALYLFVIFKASFVRHDPPHALIASSALLLMGALLYLVPGSGRWPGIAAMAVGALGYGLLAFAFLPLDPVASLARVGSKFELSVEAAWRRATEPAALAKEYPRRLVLLGDRPPFKGLSGDADLYPWDLSPLLASGASWKPRPVPQSYAAFSPPLLDANAEHLRSSPPTRIFFNINPIDQRYPSMEDGASWLTLLGGFRAQRIDAGYALLSRRDAVAETLQPRPVTSTEVRMGEDVAVPENQGPVWASIDVQPTLLGRLFSILYKAPELTLQVRYDNGETASYRFIAGLAKSGFLLSPTITDVNDFVALTSSHRDDLLGNRKVVAMGIRGASGTRLMWKSAVRVSFARLDVPTAPEADAALAGIWKHGDAVESYVAAGDCHIDTVNQLQAEGGTLDLPAGLVKVRGWSALDGARGRPNDGAFLLASATDGRTWMLPANRVPRPDVAAYFKQPALHYTGYEAFVDTRQLPEDVQIRVLQKDGEQLKVCAAVLAIRRARVAELP
ncbi:hypothetical protein [Stenotrophomonas maltophilia]|uniref:hypothetical protein n=1 Tax=Stenotrophomonas maltophilia TaxID=40324 RepID=UPI002B1E8F6A|nr:hypothetical protein [Stenotrophomonas maltophilia]